MEPNEANTVADAFVDALAIAAKTNMSDMALVMSYMWAIFLTQVDPAKRLPIVDGLYNYLKQTIEGMEKLNAKAE